MIDLSTLNIVLISICITLLILVVFVFSKITKRIDRIERDLKRIKKENDKLQLKNQELTKKASRHLNKQEVKTSQVIDEQKKVSNIDYNVKDFQEEEEEEEEEKPVNVSFDIPKVKKVFLPSPFEEKRFSIEDVSFDRNQSSLYYIDLDISEKSGNIYILEDSDFTKALNSPAQFLEKVCLFENAFSNNATRVENVQKGTVILDGDDWLVKEKIRIKFI